VLRLEPVPHNISYTGARKSWTLHTHSLEICCWVE